MINDTLTDMTVETLHDLALFTIRAVRDAAFDQGKYAQGAKIAGEVKTFAKLRCQLVKRRAGDGNAYEVVISSGGLNVKAEPAPVDGPTVTVDPQLPEHLRAQPSKPLNEANPPLSANFGPGGFARKPTIEQRVKAGEAVSITEMIDDIKAKKAASNDAGKIPAFLDRTVKSHGDIDF